MKRGVVFVGLTGGIGAGKSAVAKRLAELGAVVIDADQIAREVVAVGTPGLAAVTTQFGSAMLRADGSLDRHRLGERVFADEQERVRLNSIVHPLVRERTGELLLQAPAGSVVVHDVPLLLENEMGAGYHLVCAVLASEQHRIQRLWTRGMSTEQAKARMSHQVSDEHRRAAADVVIDNDGSLEQTLVAVDELWQHRLLPFRDNLAAGKAARLPRSLRPYDPQWPQRYARNANRLKAALSPELICTEHVGATSVPGSLAHDVIDTRVWMRGGGEVSESLAERGWFPIGTAWRVPRFATADPGSPAQLFVHSAGADGIRRED
ncbi:MAG: dephospho-CoA kinase [Mycobacteriales bacterium]